VSPTNESKAEEEVNLEYLRNVILQFLEHKEMRVCFPPSEEVTHADVSGFFTFVAESSTDIDYYFEIHPARNEAAQQQSLNTAHPSVMYKLTHPFFMVRFGYIRLFPTHMISIPVVDIYPRFK